MRLVVQRVKESNVKVENKIVGQINNGFLVLLGIKSTDTKRDADYLVKKLINLRIFSGSSSSIYSNSSINFLISFSITSPS